MSDKKTSSIQENISKIDANGTNYVNDAERTFINTHVKGWKHGVTKPYSVIKYNKVDRSRYGIMQQYEEAELSPIIVVDEIKYNGSHPEEYTQPEEQCNKSNRGAFSPSFSIPNMLLSIPNSHEDLSYNPDISIPQLCYQNYFDANGYNFVFGGLSVDMNTIESYGIPLDTDPSRISIYLSSDVPTYMNRDVFMSPYIVQNTHFFKYNALRKVIIYLDTLDSENFPGHINELMISRISDHLFFCYGGFYIKDEYLGYNKDIDRWIIKRKLILNEDGYILNLDSLKFTKIRLSRMSDDIIIPRIGSGIVSNKYVPLDKQDIMARVPSPPIFADIDETEEIKLPRSTKDGATTNSHIKNLYEPSSNPTPLKYSSTIHSSSGSTRSGLSNASIGSGSSNNKSSIFAKSTKLFHRHSIRSNNHSLKSPQLSGLQHTYSDLVNKNRSNSFNSSSSRPASPFQLSQTQVSTVKFTKDEIKSNPDNCDSDNTNSYMTGDENSTKSVDGEEDHQGTGTENSTEEQHKINPLFDKINSEPSKVSILVFIFGGFVPKTKDGYQTFKASNDLLRIELIVNDTPNEMIIDQVAPIIKLNNTLCNNGKLWPSPRGYFAYTSVDRRRNDIGEYCLNSFNVSSNSTSDAQSTFSSSTRGSNGPDKLFILEKFFYDKSLVIHGGTNEDYDTFSDFYVFDFQSYTWQLLSTYAFNYFNTQIQPFDDDDAKIYTKESKVENPKLEEAELRACHHSSIFYKTDDYDYLFFFGGYRNDYLRLFDKVPYKSDKLDVARLSKFSFNPTNQQFLRFSILNLQTQTWRFLRYYQDIAHIFDNSYAHRITNNNIWVNTRMCNIGATYSICENVVTIGHGLIVPVAEKKEDMKKLKDEIPSDILLSGARVCFTIPNV